MSQLKTYSIDEVAYAVRFALDIFISPMDQERRNTVADLAGMDREVLNRIVELVESQRRAQTEPEHQ